MPRLAMVRLARGKKSRKSNPKACAMDVNADMASFRSSLTGPSMTRKRGCTTAEAWPASCMRGRSAASDRKTSDRIGVGTGATPGRNRRTSAGSMRWRCSSVADPKASSACSTEGTAEKLPDRSASAKTAIMRGSRSGRCARKSSWSATASSSHRRSIWRRSGPGPQKDRTMSRISSRYRRTWPRMMATSAVSCASMNSRKPSSHVRITCKITGIVAGRYCTHDRPSARKMNMIERTTM